MRHRFVPGLKRLYAQKHVGKKLGLLYFYFKDPRNSERVQMEPNGPAYTLRATDSGVVEGERGGARGSAGERGGAALPYF